MIIINDLHKTFYTQKVLDGINILFNKSAITVIIGRSGEGKSVLLKHLMGLLLPDKGEVIVEGENINNMTSIERRNVRKKFGYLFQDAALFDFMNVFENVAFPLREHRKIKEKEISDLVHEKLQMVGLKDVDHKMPNELSGGMRKRVGLARAIVLDPPIIIYDEPTTGLDPIMTDNIHKLIQDTQKALKVTSIVVSHDIKAVFDIADYVGMLYKGKIIEFGTAKEMRYSENPFVRQFLEGSSVGPINAG